MKGPVALVSDAVEFAGAERYAEVLIAELGARVDVAVLMPRAAPAEMEERYTSAGARVVRVEGLARIPTPSSTRALVRALRDARPALVHVNMTDQGDALGPLASTVVGRRPTVSVLHNVIPDRARWRELVSRAALRVPHEVVSVSGAVAAYVRAGGRSTVVVENGLPPARAAQNARAELGLPADSFVVGGVGRLHRQKGWDVLCEAAGLVREQRDDVVFVVIGDGEERTALGDSRHVRFAGYRAGASSLIAGFDVLAVPSRYEAFGLVALEALQLGVPVVASEVGGLPRVLGPAGVLVPAEAPRLLADAILRLAGDPAERRRLAELGRERAEAEFSSARMAEDMLAVYSRVQREHGVGIRRG